MCSRYLLKSRKIGPIERHIGPQKPTMGKDVFVSVSLNYLGQQNIQTHLLEREVYVRTTN